jgi:hypothetical protein
MSYVRAAFRDPCHISDGASTTASTSSACSSTQPAAASWWRSPLAPRRASPLHRANTSARPRSRLRTSPRSDVLGSECPTSLDDRVTTGSSLAAVATRSKVVSATNPPTTPQSPPRSCDSSTCKPSHSGGRPRPPTEPGLRVPTRDTTPRRCPLRPGRGAPSGTSGVGKGHSACAVEVRTSVTVAGGLVVT